MSFLLAGCFVEEINGRDSQPFSRAFGFKPSDTAHSVRFGASGALMLSIKFFEDVDVVSEPCRWAPFGGALSRLISLCTLPDTDNSDLTEDILAALPSNPIETDQGLRCTPSWLRHAVQHIAEEPSVSISTLASEAGIHRTYLARAFRRYTGLSPSELRLHRKCAVAMKAMLGDACNPAEAALAGGFADQAHLTRSIRAIAGIPPAQIRRLLVG